MTHIAHFQSYHRLALSRYFSFPVSHDGRSTQKENAASRQRQFQVQSVYHFGFFYIKFHIQNWKIIKPFIISFFVHESNTKK